MPRGPWLDLAASSSLCLGSGVAARKAEGVRQGVGAGARRWAPRGEAMTCGGPAEVRRALRSAAPARSRQPASRDTQQVSAVLSVGQVAQPAAAHRFAPTAGLLTSLQPLASRAASPFTRFPVHALEAADSAAIEIAATAAVTSASWPRAAPCTAASAAAPPVAASGALAMIEQLLPPLPASDAVSASFVLRQGRGSSVADADAAETCSGWCGPSSVPESSTSLAVTAPADSPPTLATAAVQVRPRWRYLAGGLGVHTPCAGPPLVGAAARRYSSSPPSPVAEAKSLTASKKRAQVLQSASSALDTGPRVGSVLVKLASNPSSGFVNVAIFGKDNVAELAERVASKLRLDASAAQVELFVVPAELAADVEVGSDSAEARVLAEGRLSSIAPLSGVEVGSGAILLARVTGPPYGSSLSECASRAARRMPRAARRSAACVA